MGLKKKTKSVVLKLSVSEQLSQQYREVRSMADRLGHEYDVEEDLAHVLSAALLELRKLERTEANSADELQH
ncbi:hypothetical protein [uncultured Nevskia sp.]|uniref:hypothetical protein n=1 Tax=uncultured Nevskia sp. TaxID=228950 RepID=UPI0025F021D9|nr:hypothetical protein [uncultured Nevskia sp.]